MWFLPELHQSVLYDILKIEIGLPGYATHAEALAALPNDDWQVSDPDEFGRFGIERKPTAPPMTQQDLANIAFTRQQMTQQRKEFDVTQAGQAQQAGLTAQFREAEAARAAEQTRLTAQYRETGLAEQARQFDIQQQLAQQQFGQATGFQQQQLGQQQTQFQQQLQFQQQQVQMAQAEQERQYMSQLQANPMNWLQYAAYTGEPPVVQPWMVPLGAQGAEQQLQVGQPIQGVQGRESFANLPQLRTPSAQLQARWGPTAQSQFLGYRRARTGATPEETTFRLGGGRAPTGAHRGFSRFR